MAQQTRQQQRTSIPLNLDSRNVKSQYKHLDIEDIKTATDSTASELIIGFMNVAGDFNKATGIRNAAFFNIDSVMIIGKRKWDKRGAVGAWNYVPINYTPEADVLVWLAALRDDGYTVYAAENNVVDTRVVSLHDLDFPARSVVLFGEEGRGLPEYILQECDLAIEIVGIGVMRSLNVGTASGIIIYEYSVQHGFC